MTMNIKIMTTMMMLTMMTIAMRIKADGDDDDDARNCFSCYKLQRHSRIGRQRCKAEEFSRRFARTNNSSPSPPPPHTQAVIESVALRADVKQLP